MLNGVLEPRFRWDFPAPVVVPADVAVPGLRAGLSDRIVTLLVGRGVRTAADLESFLAPAVDGLHDPHLLPDAELLLARLRRARANRETVMVLGDFDADGLTGLAILVLALRACGIEVVPYVPRRLEEGHGLSLLAVDRALEAGCRVIVTVDCGTTSVAETRAAIDAGIDVVITDHHHVPPVVPDALALVNPHRTDSAYPDSRLTGSGVAFKVAALILAEMGSGGLDPLSFSDLATIGTIADMAPIVGENRSIARLGLERLRSDPRPGIAALLTRASVEPAGVDLETVAFALAPRLNSAGRIGEAGDAARLLLAESREEAEAWASVLETANTARRDITAQALAEARATIEREVTPGEAAIIVRGDWSVGVLGLVAGKLAEETALPAIVVTQVGEVLRASCRSGAGFDLAVALEECADLFVRFGGHPGAAGFELAPDRWDTFRERFLAIASMAPATESRPPLRIDLALRAAGVDYTLLHELAALAPFGPGSPEPLLAVLGLTVVRVREAAGGHTQLTLRRERDVLDAIAFGRTGLAEHLAEGDRVDIVARLVSRQFGGYESLQLEVRDVAPSGYHPEAAALLEGGVGDRVPSLPGLVPMEAR